MRFMVWVRSHSRIGNVVGQEIITGFCPICNNMNNIIVEDEDNLLGVNNNSDDMERDIHCFNICNH
jgi:hypothetical protein